MKKATRISNVIAILDGLAADHHSTKNAILDKIGLTDQDFYDALGTLMSDLERQTERVLNTPEARSFFLSQVPGEIDMAGPHNEVSK